MLRFLRLSNGENSDPDPSRRTIFVPKTTLLWPLALAADSAVKIGRSYGWICERRTGKYCDRVKAVTRLRMRGAGK